ncbi:MAG TPA: hypothetical protein VME92_12115 [Acetobacteraceae bacterium]|nr:hypothetical protein [Acetobacteraceae bacterium]
MQPCVIQDRINRGCGQAALRLGAPHDLLRPRGVNNPTAPGNRLMSLPASFNAEDEKYRRPGRFGRPLWYGVFDAAYTQVGDYLSGPAGVFFIAALQPMLPPLCVQASRTLSFMRPAAPNAAGAGSYGGVTRATATPLLGAWPASVLSAANGSHGELPSDSSIPYWSVLLPVLPVALRSSDLVNDDIGRAFVVAAAEETTLGWRLMMQQTAT